jgi:hypothetical protein
MTASRRLQNAVIVHKVRSAIDSGNVRGPKTFVASTWCGCKIPLLLRDSILAALNPSVSQENEGDEPLTSSQMPSSGN